MFKDIKNNYLCSRFVFYTKTLNYVMKRNFLHLLLLECINRQIFYFFIIIMDIMDNAKLKLLKSFW